MDTILRSVLPFLGMLVVLIMVHELGHFVTAKLAGVKVLEFGLGFPPRLWSVRKGETEYTVNALPLGGFVRLLGEEDPSDPRSLAAKPRWVRLVVLGSGAAMNVVLAIALFSLALMIPREVAIGKAQIQDVVPESPAERAGLQPGDIILKVNGRDIQNVQELSYNIRLNLGEDVTFTVRRQGSRGSGAETLEVPVHARWSAPDYIDEEGNKRPQGPTGITIGPAYGQLEPVPLDERERLEKEFPGETVPTVRKVPFTETQWQPPWEAIPDGATRSWESIILARNQIISWIRGGTGGGGGGPQVTGPVGIAQATGEVVEEAGWKSLMDFAALLSMNLAVLNILPLPMLDGGRVVFVLIEYVRRGKRISPEKEALVHFVGLVAMLTLAVVITYFDVLRIFDGEGIVR